MVVVAGLALAAVGCDWDRYDPRLAEDAGTPPTDLTCGRIDVLADDFEDGDYDDLWDGYSSSGEAVQSGGELQLTSGVSTNYGGVLSDRFFDFREGSVAVEVTSVTDPATPVRTELQVRRSDSKILVMRQQGNALVFLKSVNGGAELGRVAWDATEQRWWRIRHHEESVFWETSPDGAVWSTHLEEKLDGLFDLDYVRVRLAIYANGATVASTASFDNVTTTGPGDGTWCPSHMLSDDFSDDELADQWLFVQSYGGLSGVRHNGELVVSLVPDLEDESYYNQIPSRLHDLTANVMSLEVAEVPEAPAVVYLRASQGPNAIDMRLTDDLLTCSYVLEEEGTTTVVEEPYSPADHRWWRIRLGGGAINWEASADGLAWSSVALTSPNPISDLSKADLRFGVTAPADYPEMAHARLDNFNVSPAP